MSNDSREPTTPQLQHDDKRYENRLRPMLMSEYIGQTKIKQRLQIFIKAARERHDPLDHTLLYGPPGLGKTTLAHVIAHKMGGSIHSTSGSAIDRPGELAKILTNTQLVNGDLLFIDEIHRLPPAVEEVLYSAMEDFSVDIVLGKGASTRSVKIPLSQFTLVGATTRAGLLTSPLRNRFGVIAHLDYYSEEELIAIVHRSARILGVSVEQEGAKEIAQRSRGTPRVANRLLRRVRDYAQIKGKGVINSQIAQQALNILEIDARGLDSMDRKILDVLVHKFNGGPVGVKTLAMAVNEESETIEEVYEPYLIREGLVNRTLKGRTATPLLYEYLGAQFPQDKQHQLPLKEEPG